jgi:[acyl-carrier-protein] S-malonyltransferase
MEPAQVELANAIEETPFKEGNCPVYQNVTAKAESDPNTIKSNLIKQLTASVKWTQTMQQMQSDGLSKVIEVGPGKVLQGLFKKMDRSLETESAQIL